MKILFVTPSYFPAVRFGGPTFSTLGLVRALARRADLTVRVLTTDASGTSERLSVPRGWTIAPDGYQLRYCRVTAGTAGSLELLRCLPAALRWADVVHLTGVYGPTTIAVLLLVRLFGKPLVWAPRGSLQRWKGSRRRRLKSIWDGICNGLLAPGRVRLHVTSEAEGRASRLRMPRAEPVVVANGVDMPEPSRARLPGSGLRLMFLGRLDPQKGIPCLLDALHAVEVDVTLDIWGSGDDLYLAELKRLAAPLGARVRFRGHLAEAERPAAFDQVDALVLPSHGESFGLCVVEALASGVPVIASRKTPWARLEDEGCGLWVDNTPAKLAEAIRAIGCSDRVAMGRRGRVFVEREFAWSRIADRMRSCFVDLAESAPPPKICIVSSGGGHLTEVRSLQAFYAALPHFYVINIHILPLSDMIGRTYFVSHSERDLRFISNIWEAFCILFAERPDIILSTGAGVCVPFSLVGRLMFGCRIIYIETITRVRTPSLTARIMYHLAHSFYYQWPKLSQWFPNGELIEPLE